MNIPKHIRDRAAMICAIAASNEWDEEQPAGGKPPPRMSSPAAELAWSAWEVVFEAWRSAPDRDSNGSDRWAEAEAMIRTGWSP